MRDASSVRRRFRGLRCLAAPPPTRPSATSLPIAGLPAVRPPTTEPRRPPRARDSVELLARADAGPSRARAAEPVKLCRLGRRLAPDGLDVLVLCLELQLELGDARLERVGPALGPRRLGGGRLEPAEVVGRLDELEREREGPGEDEREAERAARQVEVALGVELPVGRVAGSASAEGETQEEGGEGAARTDLARVDGLGRAQVGRARAGVLLGRLGLLRHAHEALDGVGKQEGDEDEGYLEGVLDLGDLRGAGRARGRRVRRG